MTTELCLKWILMGLWTREATTSLIKMMIDTFSMAVVLLLNSDIRSLGGPVNSNFRETLPERFFRTKKGDWNRTMKFILRTGWNLWRKMHKKGWYQLDRKMPLQTLSNMFPNSKKRSHLTFMGEFSKIEKYWISAIEEKNVWDLLPLLDTLKEKENFVEDVVKIKRTTRLESQ